MDKLFVVTPSWSPYMFFFLSEYVTSGNDTIHMKLLTSKGKTDK